MPRYFLDISYNGGAYHGWQTQPNATSVQETIEEALRTLRQQPTPIVGAGRTDSGVHASGMVAHLDLDVALEGAEALALRLDRLLPPDIAIRGIRIVPEGAHARFDATRRTYHYHISYEKNPFREGFVLRMHRQLDFDQMNEAARYLLGRKDFSSFAKLHTDVKTHICEVYEAEWCYLEEAREWRFTITADRFLRNMVRAVVGTLFKVGWGQITPQEFRDLIALEDRQKAGSSAPAHALSLVKVDYPY